MSNPIGNPDTLNPRRALRTITSDKLKFPGDHAGPLRQSLVLVYCLLND